MNKIFNWTFGSIFRTLGRIIAYIIIGAIAVILFSGHIKKPKISDIFTDIFFMKVDALESVHYEWIPNMWDTNGNSLSYAYYGYKQTDSFGATPGQWFGLKTWYFNSAHSDSGGGVAIPPKAKLAVLRLFVSSDSHVDTSYSFESYLLNNWGGGQTCEVVSDVYQPYINYFEGTDTGGTFSRNLTVKCYLDNNATSLSGFLFKYNFSPYMNSVDLSMELAGDIGFLYEEVSNTDIASAINNQTNSINNQTNTIHQDNISINNSIQGQTNTIHQDNAVINDSINSINNTISDETGPSNLNGISNSTLVGYLPPGPVDSLLNLPLVLLNSLQNALSSSCSPVTLTLPFVNSDIVLPCMSTLYESMGVSSFVNWAGIVASAFILFSYLIRFYKWVDNTLTFRENNWLDNWGGE